jgi:DNA-binding Lrp family transcriptional regulator
MARPEPGFSLEDLYAEITPDEDNPDGAMTVREIRGETGMGEDAVRERVRKLLAEGKLEVTKKRIVDMSGRRMTVAAYRVKEKKD